MGFWGRLVGREKSGTAKPDRWLIDWVRGGDATASGASVSPDTAMRIAAVWACVRVRSEDIGKIPLHMYRRTGAGKERATDHPYYSLVRDAPNPNQTAMEFRQLMQTWLDLRGNAYALKDINAAGKVTALWPLCPEYVQVKLVEGSYNELFYSVRLPYPGRQEMIVPGEYMLHLRGLSLDGLVGVSPVTYHREGLGMALAAEKYGASFFGGSAQPTGILKSASKLSPEAAAAVRASWERNFKDNKRNFAILDMGMEWLQMGMNNDDAQYLETRKFQIEEICRLYRMPPHKIADLEHATFSNIEQSALEYVQDCLMSEAVRWEQTLWRELLSDAEKKVYFFEFMLESLIRGDLPSMMSAFATARNWGIMSANDCRDKLNMNPVPDGDIYLQPQNMVEAGTDMALMLQSQRTNPNNESPTKRLSYLAPVNSGQTEQDIAETQ